MEELKNAGFQFKDKSCERCKEMLMTCNGGTEPNLEELLEITKQYHEECNTYFELVWSGKEWLASLIKCNDQCVEITRNNYFGKTPKEAIIKLLTKQQLALKE